MDLFLTVIPPEYSTHIRPVFDSLEINATGARKNTFSLLSLRIDAM